MPPSVSICLPCLNSLPYLAACLRSIELQHGVEWELIACDGFSTDGTWEMLVQFCSIHPRCTAFQSSLSLYEAWNQCIERASCPYIYIATSDDVVDEDALKIMVSALDEYPACGVCQIQLSYIDESGALLPEAKQWRTGRLSKFSPGLTTLPNIRFAPHDGVLMAAFHTVYESVNQLLIRTEVFHKVGFFDPSFGAVGDFEWGMRVGLTQNCVYLPHVRAYWRKHPAQVTQPAFTTHERLQALVMTRTAYHRASVSNPESLPQSLLHAMEDVIYDDYISAMLSERFRLPQVLSFYAAEICIRPLLVIRRLIRVAYRATTTTFDYDLKSSRIKALMKLFGVAAPRFL